MQTRIRQRGGRDVATKFKGVRLVRSCTINRPRNEVFRECCEPRSLPGLLRKLFAWDAAQNSDEIPESVEKILEADVALVNVNEDELIAWKTTEDSALAHAGTLRLEPGPAGRGTEVRVLMEYEPPKGKVGTILAKLMGKDPATHLSRGLARFKAAMETGEMPSVRGQPQGES